MGPHMGTLQVPIINATIMGPEGSHMGTCRVPIIGHYLFSRAAHPSGVLNGDLMVPICAPFGCTLSPRRTREKMSPEGNNFGLFSRGLLANLRVFIFLFSCRTLRLLNGHPAGTHMGTLWGTHSLRVKIFYSLWHLWVPMRAPSQIVPVASTGLEPTF